MLIEAIKAFIYGVLEGITEWLPVSSTGHIILLESFMPLRVGQELGSRFIDEFHSMFEVVIQVGAILAVVVSYFGKLNPFSPSKSPAEKKRTWTLLMKVVVASIPAGIVGVIGDGVIELLTGKDIDGWAFNWQTVAATLIIWGVLFIIIERAQKNKTCSVASTDDISFSQAALVGCFQAISIVPGTSRSGSTILGARIIGISRPAAAEFSFFMGIPVILGASLIKSYGFVDYVTETGISVPAAAYVCLAIASAVAFAVSMFAIRFLTEFVKKHSFAPFGVYRIVLGAIVILYFALFS